MSISNASESRRPFSRGLEDPGTEFMELVFRQLYFARLMPLAVGLIRQPAKCHLKGNLMMHQRQEVSKTSLEQ